VNIHTEEEEKNRKIRKVSAICPRSCLAQTLGSQFGIPFTAFFGVIFFYK
jgi:hypothetical protein